jgi:shikimate kinase/3-dehydroquinate synthase
VEAALSRALVFVGFMGAGKTTSARAAAAALGTEAIDTDRLVEEEAGTPVAQLFAEHGEGEFRVREEKVVLEVLERAGAGQAVSLGGGAVTSPRVREALRAHRVVWLEADAETLWRRAHGPERPLTADRERFELLLAERAAVYEDAADVILPAAAGNAVTEALPWLAVLDRAPEGTRLLWAQAASGSYPVFVGAGLVAAGLRPLDGRGFLVTDTTVAGHHAAAFADAVHSMELEPGEEHKTVATAELLWRELARTEMTRTDHLVALGGGVVGDVAGFCAATYQRGVPVVQVPTTLVAQVDSAFGGKTGVDIPEGKNYVGAYHQPAAVLVDPDLLGTLPPEEVAAGYAEVVKTALIAGGPLWERVRAGAPATDPDVISGCIRTKLAVVAEDERDAGRRQVLNLGHTVAHAIETATGYSRYRHGEAVALGLLAALRLSGDEALREEVAGLLGAAGLPARLDGVAPEAVVEATARDKKRRGSEPVPFVLVTAPGDVTFGNRVARDDVLAAVRELA